MLSPLNNLFVNDVLAPLLLLGQDPFMRKELMRRCYFSNHFVGRVGASQVGLCALEFALCRRGAGASCLVWLISSW